MTPWPEVIAIADRVKPSAADAVRALKADGLRLVMLTGDARTTALAVAGPLGITEVVAQGAPQDKAAMVQRLKAEGRRVAMAGDGVNDSPALAAADVGVAMGGGGGRCDRERRRSRCWAATSADWSARAGSRRR